MLDAATQAEILRLFYSQKISRRQISKQLGIHRTSVSHVINRGSVLTEGRKRCNRQTLLEPYHPFIEKLLKESSTRSAVNIFQQLRPVGYPGGISTLRYYLQGVRPAPSKKAFLTLNFLPGEAAQVDWGEFGDVFLNGTKVHCFVMVLCFSRMLYVEFTQRETLSTLLRCYERALHFFGGPCREHWHDNMPTVVVERVSNLVRFTTRFSAYAGFRHFKPIACHLNAGHEKGRVEDGVKLVRHQFWPGRSFIDIEDINRQAREWLDTFANRREHAATKKIPELVFEQEKVALLPLAAESYDTDDVESLVVSKFYRVRFETNTYSVPWAMVGKPVTLRAKDDHVHIFFNEKRIASHRREYRKNQDIKNPLHEQDLHAIKPGATATFNIEAVKCYGPKTCRYLELIAAGTRSLRQEIKELLVLGTVYGQHDVEECISFLLEQGMVGINYVERQLRLNHQETHAPAPLTLQNEQLRFIPPAPQLQTYDALLIDATIDTHPQKIEEMQSCNPIASDPLLTQAHPQHIEEPQS